MILLLLVPCCQAVNGLQTPSREGPRILDYIVGKWLEERGSKEEIRLIEDDFHVSGQSPSQDRDWASVSGKNR